MKKLLTVLLLALSLGLMAGCGEDDSSKPSPKPNPDVVDPDSKPGSQDPDSKPDEVKVEYEISFYNEKSELIEAKKFLKDSKVSYSYEPTDTKEYDYSLKGWKLNNTGEAITNLPNATGNAKYYAVVEGVKNQYTLSYEVNGGSEIEATKAEYGTKLEKPTDPTKEGYKFMAWFLDEALETEVVWPLELKDNTKIYAKWQEEVKLLDYLKSLLKGYKMDPWSYIPDNLKPNAKVVDSYNANYDSFKNVNTIKTGYGEEWAMIIDNLSQSEAFYKTLNVIEGISSASVVAYQNYLDTNPSDVNSFTHKSGNYKVSIHYENNIMSYGVGYHGKLPLVGEEDIKLIICYNILTGERIGKIEAGANNAIKYSVTENSYTFGIKYLNMREAYLRIEKDDEGNAHGAIYEFLHLEDKSLSSSAAEFYITEDYVTAIGNKASGLIGFKGYISELYNAKTGAMLGYEVKESQEILGISVDFNTLWFNLSDVRGINTIKGVKKEEVDLTNPYSFYLNNSNKLFEAMKVGGISKKSGSRRYDLEMRKTYLYTYDSEKKENVRVEALVPMLFIQEENLDTLAKDIKSKNNLDISLTIKDADKAKLMDDYANLLPKFIENKDKITKDNILEYIG